MTRCTRCPGYHSVPPESDDWDDNPPFDDLYAPPPRLSNPYYGYDEISRHAMEPSYLPRRSRRNPPEWHAGGGFRDRGRWRPGSGRRHHHFDPTEWHAGGGVRYRGEWRPGAGHWESNPPFDDLYAPPPRLSNPHVQRNWIHSGGMCAHCGVRLRVGEGIHGESGGYSNVLYCCEACKRAGEAKDNPPFDDLYAPPPRLSNPHSCRCHCHEDHEDHEDNPPFDDLYAAPPRLNAPMDDLYAPPPRLANPKPRIAGTKKIQGYTVAKLHSGSSAKYHRVRVSDKRWFKESDTGRGFRTKTLSEKKGIKAVIGLLKAKGPRGGRTEIQSFMFDADQYTVDDAIKWVLDYGYEPYEGQGEPGVYESPITAKVRRLRAPKKKAPRKRKTAAPKRGVKKVPGKKKPAAKKKAKKKRKGRRAG
jgi:hypothetical protein